MGTAAHRETIVPRENLNFDLLNSDIPRHWFAGDPFKTRFFDAMSMLFPEGEKFFINCVRDYREKISDPKLLEEVKNFIRQEGQHTKVHRDYNARLKNQGIDTETLENENGFRLERFRKKLPKTFTLAMTAAAEHLTATLAHGFLSQPKQFTNADPRPTAVYMWHGVEEIEHKGVAFDVMRDIADVGYLERTVAMVGLTVVFPHRIMLALDDMLKADGYSLSQRTVLWANGLKWLFGPGGFCAPMREHYFSYYAPGFHPWEHGDLADYHAWLSKYETSGDPIAATKEWEAAQAA